MNKFKQIYLEISHKCNLNCNFCPYKSNNDGHFWNKDDVEKVILETKEYTNSYYLHVLGEPLLNPNLKDILELFSLYNKEVKITTNGLLLKERRKLLLSCDKLTHLNISFESWIPFKKEQIDLLVLDVVNFIKEKEELNKKLTIELRFWNNKDDTKVKEFNNYVISKFSDYGLDLSIKHLREYLITSYNDEFEWPSISDNYNNKLNKCLGGIHQLAVLNNGELCLCCLDYSGKTSLGNIFNNSFKNIISSDSFNEFLDLRKKNLCYFELCKSCKFRNKFIK